MSEAKVSFEIVWKSWVQIFRKRLQLRTPREAQLIWNSSFQQGFTQEQFLQNNSAKTLLRWF